MKNQLTEYVAGEEVTQALRNWDAMMNPNTPWLAQNSFSTFIGPHELVPDPSIEYMRHVQNTWGWNVQNTWGWKVSELSARKIKILASPHHYALLKAFKARTGWQGIIP